jgi:Telomere recombination
MKARHTRHTFVHTYIPSVLGYHPALQVLLLRGIHTLSRTAAVQLLQLRAADCSADTVQPGLLCRPLLCTSVRVEEDQGLEIPDVGSMLDMYPSIDFIVDCGPAQVAEPSTVVDMTGAYPEVVRVGKGDPSPFDAYQAA